MLSVIWMLACGSEPEVELVDEEVVEEVVPEPEAEPEKMNHQPHVVSLGFEKDTYMYSDTIAIDYETFDPDGDATREEIFWSLNGKELISEKGKTFRRKDIKKGDELTATLVVKDGKLENQQSVKTTIGNAPPQWLRDPRTLTKIDGYTVEAVDPDGDALTYRLTGAPEGMSISERGRISYSGSTTEPGGAYTITVIAEDTEKALVQWSFSIQLSPGSDAKK